MFEYFEGIQSELLLKIIVKLTCIRFCYAMAKQHKEIIHETTHHNFIAILKMLLILRT